MLITAQLYMKEFMISKSSGSHILFDFIVLILANNPYMEYKACVNKPNAVFVFLKKSFDSGLYLYFSRQENTTVLKMRVANKVNEKSIKDDHLLLYNGDDTYNYVVGQQSFDFGNYRRFNMYKIEFARFFFYQFLLDLQDSSIKHILSNFRFYVLFASCPLEAKNALNMLNCLLYVSVRGFFKNTPGFICKLLNDGVLIYSYKIAQALNKCFYISASQFSEIYFAVLEISGEIPLYSGEYFCSKSNYRNLLRKLKKSPEIIRSLGSLQLPITLYSDHEGKGIPFIR